MALDLARASCGRKIDQQIKEKIEMQWCPCWKKEQGDDLYR
jgi:hypothetical protein